MAKNKRLTEEQCKPLFDIMRTSTYEGITKALKYASEHEDYDPKEVKIFIRNNYEVVAFIADRIIDDIAREQLNQLASDIDFPNFNTNSENKSSDTKNTER